jgi:hypothetical protein
MGIAGRVHRVHGRRGRLLRGLATVGMHNMSVHDVNTLNR